MAIKEIIKDAIYAELDHFLEHRKYSKDSKTFTVTLSHKKMDKETERLYHLLFCNWGGDILDRVYEEITKNVHKDLEGK